ncbi:hypothetical protein ACFY8C_19710 [Streptomyces flavochromogenes]|uniref:Uncharacterized protein n=1 Tax=Streptomyces flavochromogenes TaxID=68199 RepID=A0ABW6XSR8_9ACTN|nr:hypothetical protein [Streptomyces flavochromogenes]
MPPRTATAARRATPGTAPASLPWAARAMTTPTAMIPTTRTEAV